MLSFLDKYSIENGELMIKVKKINVIKLFILFVITIFVSGCDVEYNLTIDEKLNITEEVYVTEDESSFENLLYMTKLEAINGMLKPYEEALRDSQYEYTIVNEPTRGGVKLVASYKNIDEFSRESNLAEFKFTGYDVIENGNIITIKTTSIPFIYFEEDRETIPIKNVALNIKVPFTVTNSSADKIDGDTYTWLIGEELYDKVITISFDKSKLSNHLNIFGINIHYGYFVAVGAVITLCLYGIVLYKKNQSINRI